MTMNRLKITPKINCYDVAIIGAGAAGLFCAATAAKRGLKVLVLEHNEKVGAKILISGGGRCNFTNRKVGVENFVSKNPQFARSALSQYPQSEFVKLLASYGIQYYEKTLGQLFCEGDGSAKNIVNMLLKECEKGDVTIKTQVNIKAIDKEVDFYIETENLIYQAKNLVIATGGISIPKMGASGFAYEIAKQFGVECTKTHPALVPLIFDNPNDAWMKELAGVATEAIVFKDKQKFEEAVLFTHKGLSGPAILQISNYLEEDESFKINFMPKFDAHKVLLAAKFKLPKQNIGTFLSGYLPQRLAKALVEKEGLNRPFQEIKNNLIEAFAHKLQNYEFKPSGTEGYAKAEATRGGISTNELNQKTFEAKKISGLYFIGECVDMTGWLGGYNFAWAWASAYACGNNISIQAA